MAINQRGFIATRSLAGHRPMLKMFPVNATANAAYYINQPVKLDAAKGQVSRVEASTSAPEMLGVIQTLFGSSGGEPRPLIGALPTNGACLATAQAGFALVNVDPWQTYIAYIDVSASAGLVGMAVNSSANNAGNLATGISNASLAGASVGIEGLFKIIGLAPHELAQGRGDKAAGTGVEVKLNSSIFQSTTVV